MASADGLFMRIARVSPTNREILNEAKPQNDSTVTGYRTLVAGDIEVVNRFKDLSRH